MKGLAEYFGRFTNSFMDNCFVGGECITRKALSEAKPSDLPIIDIFIYDQSNIAQVKQFLNMYNHEFDRTTGYWVNTIDKHRVLVHFGTPYPNVEQFLNSRVFTVEAVAYSRGSFVYHEDWAFDAMCKELHMNSDYSPTTNPVSDTALLNRVFNYVTEGFTVGNDVANYVIAAIRNQKSVSKTIAEQNDSIAQALKSLEKAVK